MTEVLFLSSDEVTDLAEPADYVDAVRSAYRQRGRGAPAEPRTALESDDPPGMFTTYAAILPETGAMGGYMYSAGFGARDAWFVTPLYDAETGTLQAIIDGASMNPFKTGAAGAVGVDALAREDATEVAVFGSGAQARGQLRATATVRDLERVRVYSTTRENRIAFAEEMTDVLGIPVEAVPAGEGSLAGADIVITATNATEPVFDGTNLEPGTHVTAMGQYHTERFEIDATTVERSVYVPDLEDRVYQDAGAFLNARSKGAIDDDDHVHAELGAVVAGMADGRTDPEQITLFDSGGTGIETVAAAHLLYERARAENLGTVLSFSPASEALTGR
ncbi:ornithine cyclodeaminase family protein [Halanaeroarchaeum sulfurireducens]|uniref:Ornithine cyclodeaminase n=1 Tax=Halanaeroarchaeum sulfurireducens TaxID=1604004 RepID=A0A0F7PBN5_9EURY|nr:ornithine cyclodeaminase family protein [Halanaeroarchaeum sulfurireducens]AKH97570.1 ornithine cyclodeaminase [Halanaeroarchaeum sulfurireducens]